MRDLVRKIPFHVAQAVLRYTYDKQLFEDYLLKEGNLWKDSPYIWREMCRAAATLGVLELQKLAVARLDVALDNMLYDTLMDSVLHGRTEKVQQSIEDFVEELALTYESGYAEEPAVKLCCQYFTYLQGHDESLQFADAHPEFLRKMLSCAAKHGEGALRCDDLLESLGFDPEEETDVSET